MVVPRNMGYQITMGIRGRVDEVYYVNCNIYSTIEGTPCTCIASGTNSINVRHVKGQKRFVEEACGEEWKLLN